MPHAAPLVADEYGVCCASHAHRRTRCAVLKVRRRRGSTARKNGAEYEKRAGSAATARQLCQTLCSHRLPEARYYSERASAALRRHHGSRTAPSR